MKAILIQLIIGVLMAQANFFKRDTLLMKYSGYTSSDTDLEVYNHKNQFKAKQLEEDRQNNLYITTDDYKSTTTSHTSESKRKTRISRLPEHSRYIEQARDDGEIEIVDINSNDSSSDEEPQMSTTKSKINVSFGTTIRKKRLRIYDLINWKDTYRKEIEDDINHSESVTISPDDIVKTKTLDRFRKLQQKIHSFQQQKETASKTRNHNAYSLHNTPKDQEELQNEVITNSPEYLDNQKEEEIKNEYIFKLNKKIISEKFNEIPNREDNNDSNDDESNKKPVKSFYMKKIYDYEGPIKINTNENDEMNDEVKQNESQYKEKSDELNKMYIKSYKKEKVNEMPSEENIDSSKEVNIDDKSIKSHPHTQYKKVLRNDKDNSLNEDIKNTGHKTSRHNKIDSSEEVSKDNKNTGDNKSNNNERDTESSDEIKKTGHKTISHNKEDTEISEEIEITGYTSSNHNKNKKETSEEIKSTSHKTGRHRKKDTNISEEVEITGQKPKHYNKRESSEEATKEVKNTNHKKRNHDKIEKETSKEIENIGQETSSDNKKDTITSKDIEITVHKSRKYNERESSEEVKKEKKNAFRKKNNNDESHIELSDEMKNIGHRTSHHNKKEEETSEAIKNTGHKTNGHNKKNTEISEEIETTSRKLINYKKRDEKKSEEMEITRHKSSSHNKKSMEISEEIKKKGHITRIYNKRDSSGEVNQQIKNKSHKKSNNNEKHTESSDEIKNTGHGPSHHNKKGTEISEEIKITDHIPSSHKRRELKHVTKIKNTRYKTKKHKKESTETSEEIKKNGRQTKNHKKEIKKKGDKQSYKEQEEASEIAKKIAQKLFTVSLYKKKPNYRKSNVKLSRVRSLKTDMKNVEKHLKNDSFTHRPIEDSNETQINDYVKENDDEKAKTKEGYEEEDENKSIIKIPNLRRNFAVDNKIPGHENFQSKPKKNKELDGRKYESKRTTENNKSPLMRTINVNELNGTDFKHFLSSIVHRIVEKHNISKARGVNSVFDSNKELPNENRAVSNIKSLEDASEKQLNNDDEDYNGKWEGNTKSKESSISRNNNQKYLNSEQKASKFSDELKEDRNKDTDLRREGSTNVSEVDKIVNIFMKPKVLDALTNRIQRKLLKKLEGSPNVSIEKENREQLEIIEVMLTSKESEDPDEDVEPIIVNGKVFIRAHHHDQ